MLRRLNHWQPTARLEWLFRAYLDLCSEAEVLEWGKAFEAGHWRKTSLWGAVFEYHYRYDDRAQRLARKYSKI